MYTFLMMLASRVSLYYPGIRPSYRGATGAPKPRRANLATRSKKPSLGDDLLDFVLGKGLADLAFYFLMS